MRKDVLSMFLNVYNVGAERMSSGRLFQAIGSATQNARLPSCSLVLGTTKSPRAAELRADSSAWTRLTDVRRYKFLVPFSGII